jgi:mannose-P-dolichol utilization defect protein 1
MSDASDATFVATALGYVLGLGSLLLYTPIAVRVYRQKHADGLVMSTWWLKLSAYTCSNIYYFTKSYPLSTYIETLTIDIEAAVILGLVAFYQKRIDYNFWMLLVVYLTLSAYGLTMASAEIIALGQVGAAALNSAALLPQFYLNYKLQTKGDYSPLTAGLAASGCAIRLFTITQLADSDPILLGSFGLALVLNTLLLLQILWYGVMVEGLSLIAVLTADLGNPKKATTMPEETEMEEVENLMEYSNW